MVNDISAKKELQDWLGERIPAVPSAFLPFLLGELHGTPTTVDLTGIGEGALQRALEQPGRRREAAFHLLAADAFFTYACEAVAREDDVEGGLKTLLARLGDRFA